MKQKTKIFKIILLVVVIAIMVAVTIYLIPTFKELSSEAGQQAFKQKVNDSGFVGFLMLFGLQFAQIFLLIKLTKNKLFYNFLYLLLNLNY